MAAEKILLEQKIRIHEKEYSKAKALHASLLTDFHALTETFKTAELQSNEIKVLLRLQLDESKNVVVRLTKAFSDREVAWVSGTRFPVSKFKRTGVIRKK